MNISVLRFYGYIINIGEYFYINIDKTKNNKNILKLIKNTLKKYKNDINKKKIHLLKIIFIIIYI